MLEAKPRLLIVDDDVGMLASASRALRSDFEVMTASVPAEAEKLFGVGPDVVLLDVRLDEQAQDDRGGVVLLERFRTARPAIPVVMISAYGDMDTAVQCMRLGAMDFLKKPPDVKELRHRLRAAIEHARLSRRATELEEQLQRLDPTELVGDSSPMQQVKRLIQMVAQDGYATVLILGETGTGKELVARAIHRSGWRCREPFVAVAISALNPSIVESELFGHEPGAFTGATERRIGFIEKAQGGVLFLDEIGDLPEQAQLKLLRFLEERTFTRAGSTSEQKSDVQVLAATNCDLEKAVAEGRVRKDFYYRLKNIQVALPPLRERADDIPALAGHFLDLFARQGRTKVTQLDDLARQAMLSYPWPGNVRELRAALERAVIYANQHGHGCIKNDDLPLEVLRPRVNAPAPAAQSPSGDEPVDLDVELARTELAHVEAALVRADGRKDEAWKLLGLNDRFALRRRVGVMLRRYPQVARQFPLVWKLYGKKEA